MKKWLLALCLGLNCYAYAEDKQLPITNFSGGLNSYYSSLTIDDTQVKDANNVLFDLDNAVDKRKGFTNCGSSKTYSYDSGWSYTDSSNSTWLIVRSSDTIMAGSSPCTFTVKIATVSVNNIVNAVNAFGKIYFIDQSQGVYSWDGVTTTFISGSPKGSLITEFRNRLWVAGLLVPSGNLLYASKYLDGSTWTTGSLSTDPLVIQIGLQDNYDNISALFSGYNDTLIIFRTKAIYALFGFDQTDFSTRILTRDVGCIDQRSVQSYLGNLIFVSLRGVESFDGVTATLLSKPVKDKVDPAIQITGLSQNYWTQSVTSDWVAGTIVSLSTSSNAPSLTLSGNNIVTDTTTIAFASGTLNNVTVADNKVSLTIDNNATVSNPSFETGDFTSWNNTSFSVVTSASDSYGGCGTVSPTNGSYFASAPDNASCGSGSCQFFACLSKSNHGNCNNAVYISPVNNDCSWHTTSITPTSITPGELVYFDVYYKGGTQSILSNSLYISGGAITFDYRFNWETGSTHAAFAIDNIRNGVSSISNGSFTSRVIDTGSVKSYLLGVSSSATINTYTPTVLFQSSPDSTSWSNLGTSFNTNYLANRYLRYISTFTPSGSDIALSYLNSVTYNWAAASGTFKSQIHTIGNINSWGNFSVTDNLNGGNIAFSICGSTNSNMSAPVTCASQTENSQITIATKTYVQWYATFTVTAATQTPTLNSGVVQWFTGTRSVPMASTIYDNRYWLSLTTVTSSTENNAVLVLTKGPVWSVFDIKVGALIPYKSNLYHTNNQANGKVYLDWQGYNDDGVAIDGYVRSKDYAPDGFMVDKLVRSLHLIAEPLGAYTVSSSYEVDRSGIFYSFSDILASELSGRTSLNLYRQKSTSYAPYGKTISIKFSNNVVNQPMKIYGGNLVYQSRPVIQ